MRDILFTKEWSIDITDIAISDICQYKGCEGKIEKEATLTLGDGNDDDFEQTFLVCNTHFQIIKDWWLSLRKWLAKTMAFKHENTKQIIYWIIYYLFMRENSTAVHEHQDSLYIL